LLEGLEERIGKLTQNTVIVLHQKGSHGPDYFHRYPDRFERYKPVCKSSDLSRCEPTSIRNAYDNTILYTDYIVWQVLEAVEHGTRVNGALLYISDHGESLGEHGLYLHGAPKLLAPRYQVQVPMVAWLSRPFAQREQIDMACVRGRTANHYSHDNLFHTVLGLMNVETTEYKSALDIFAECKHRPSGAVGKSAWRSSRVGHG
jgi:lipid A ethanolaminephosphotransferase